MAKPWPYKTTQTTPGILESEASAAFHRISNGKRMQTWQYSQWNYRTMAGISSVLAIKFHSQKRLRHYSETYQTTSYCNTIRIRPATSLIVLSRMSSDVSRHLGHFQARFRPGQSTADVVWTQCRLASEATRYGEELLVLRLGTSNSKASYEVIDRIKLLHAIRSATDSLAQMRCVLILLTVLTVKVGPALSVLRSIISTPQGDGVQHVLHVLSRGYTSEPQFSLSVLPLSSPSQFSLSVLPLSSPSQFSLSVLPLSSPSQFSLSPRPVRDIFVSTAHRLCWWHYYLSIPPTDFGVWDRSLPPITTSYLHTRYAPMVILATALATPHREPRDAAGRAEDKWSGPWSHPRLQFVKLWQKYFVDRPIMRF